MQHNKAGQQRVLKKTDNCCLNYDPEKCRFAKSRSVLALASAMGRAAVAACRDSIEL
jgi:hypothetical protein